MRNKKSGILMREALVVLSGGQDSTVCLYWAKSRFDSIKTVTFDYGQRHRIEIDCARKIAKLADVPNEVLPINTFQRLGGNALTSAEPVEKNVPANSLPNTFVPGRNLIFLTFAAAYAWQNGIADLVTGVCQTDYSGYPDCRQNTITAMQLAINLGMDTQMTIHTPLMWLTKAETVYLARDLGALPALAWSHTCYNGQFPPCGECPACQLRAKGFETAGIPDPLLSRT
ncbi:MAG: 7-cyano-7-deazaguanine synthase QueC [SAR324 cluster bacterium]|nr:7-cyano-7-deazaguanine synthase QueC [SAR324 cluster bacterium]